MTAIAVLYLDTLGQPLAALSTTVPGDPPPLNQAATFRMAVPIADPLAAPAPGPAIPRPLVVAGAELAVAVFQAEFDDPLDIFQWRVVTTTNPDGTKQHRLDRLGTGRVTLAGTSSGRELVLHVPRLGNEEELDFEVRNQAGFKHTGVLQFATTDTQSTTVHVPDVGDFVALVEGYSPAVPSRLTVTREGAGTKAGLELVLDVPRLGDKLELGYEVRQAGETPITGKLTFGATDTRTTHRVTVTDKAACDVLVEGYPLLAVPAAP